MNASIDNLVKTRRVILDLFDKFAASGAFKVGETEENINNQFVAFAKEKFGLTNIGTVISCVLAKIRFWAIRIAHKAPFIYKKMTIFLDFGPVIDGWEGDVGRTYLIGHDPEKQRLLDDLEVFHNVKLFTKTI